MEPKRPHVIVLAGPNGAGKSTAAPALLADTMGVVEFVNADTIAQGLSAFQPEATAFQAGRIMLERLHVLAERRLDFAFETTLASRTFAPWISDLRERKCVFHLLFLWLERPEVAVARVAERVRLGGHAVPEEVIRRRYRSGLRNFFTLYQPLADQWRFYDNSSGPAPRLLARGRGKHADTVHDQQTWDKIIREAIS